jgi:hypothetical protein
MSQITNLVIYDDNGGDPTLPSNTAGVYGKTVDGITYPVALSESGVPVILTRKSITLYVVDFNTALETGDGKIYWRIPVDLDSMNLVYAAGQLGAAQSTSGTVDIQVARLRFATPGGARSAVDMLSTPITIDANEWDSKDGTSGVININNDDVVEGDLIRADIDSIGTGSQGLLISLTFE